MTGAVIFGGLGIACCMWCLWKLSTAPAGFQTKDGRWLPGTPEEWGITPDEAE